MGEGGVMKWLSLTKEYQAELNFNNQSDLQVKYDLGSGLSQFLQCLRGELSRHSAESGVVGGWAGELWQRLGLRGVQRCRGEGLRAPEAKSPLYNSATLLSSVPLCSTNLLSKTTTLCNCTLCDLATLLLCSATRVWG